VQVAPADGGTSRRPVSIIVPATGLKDFQKILADMVKAETEIPPEKESPPGLIRLSYAIKPDWLSEFRSSIRNQQRPCQ
jgi:hypothetical protein